MAVVSLCLFDASSLAAFSGYLLPAAKNRCLRASGGDAERFTLAGAVWDNRACAAAAVEWDGASGHILSLFVDPQARGFGIAGRIVELLRREAERRGASGLDCDYVLRDAALDAMDALFFRQGAELRNVPPVYGTDSRRFLDSALLGPALRSGFSAPPEIVCFSALSREQLGLLEGNAAIPGFLRPSARAGFLDPELSVAWLAEGTVAGYVLGCQSGDGMFDLTGLWRGPDAPEGCLRAMVREQLNRCWYRCGGDFHFFFCPVNEPSARIAERLTEGRYVVYARHRAIIHI